MSELDGVDSWVGSRAGAAHGRRWICPDFDMNIVDTIPYQGDPAVGGALCADGSAAAVEPTDQFAYADLDDSSSVRLVSASERARAVRPACCVVPVELGAAVGLANEVVGRHAGHLG